MRSCESAPERADSSRGIALAITGALHIAVIAMLVAGTDRATFHMRVEPESTAQVLLLQAHRVRAPTGTQLPQTERGPVEPARIPPASSATTRSDERPQPSSAITAPPIDWHHEAATSARRFVESEAAQENEFDLSGQRQTAEGRGAAGAAQPPAFGWSSQRRVQVEDGIPILRLGEKCVLVAFLIPACAFGRIEARGDLFEAMAAPAEAGDWKETQ